MKVIREHKFIAACLLIAAVIVIWSLAAMFRVTDEDIAEQTESIRDTIYGRALQCYVIEGAYPESLDYLEQNYGLTVNREDYLIVYTPFADNLPPQIKVKYRGEGR